MRRKQHCRSAAMLALSGDLLYSAWHKNQSGKLRKTKKGALVGLMETINEGPAAGKHAQAERGAVLTPGEKLGTCSRGTGFGANTCEKLSLKAQCQLQKGNYSAQD